MDFVSCIKRSLSIFRQYLNDININKGEQIRFYNFWNTQVPREMWLTRFIEHRGLIQNYSGKINFYSVLGYVEWLKYRRRGINIFFSGENMHADRFSKYHKVCEQNPFNLSIGFESNHLETYIRFPLWILFMFEPESTYEDVKAKVDRLSNVNIGARTRFCSLVASHDWNGLRGEIIDSLQSIDSVTSGGKFRQNTDELNIEYKDDKYEFIKQFKFNICPENSNAEGYVTEKIFQSIEAGCIPIYWGSNNNPETDILNQNAILCWKQGENNDKTLSVIQELVADEKKYIDFASQQRLLPNAADIIWSHFHNLEQQLKYLINDK